MNKFDQLLRQVVQKSELNVEIKKDWRGLLVTFENGRRQRIKISRKQDRYIISSMVLKRKQVEEIGRTQVLARLWQRNRNINVVTFSLNQRGHLFSQIEQLAETIDAEELVFYVELLARECDQFEYVLTGRDLY